MKFVGDTSLFLCTERLSTQCPFLYMYGGSNAVSYSGFLSCMALMSWLVQHSEESI